MVVQNSWTTSQDLNRSHLSLGGLHGRGLAVPICTRPRGGLPERGSAASLKGGGSLRKGKGGSHGPPLPLGLPAWWQRWDALYSMNA